MPCHAPRVAAQQKTHHARALAPWSGNHFAGRKITDKAGTEFAFTPEGVRVRRGDQEIEAPIRWAFGSGAQALTPVLERAGKLIELRISWYAQGNRLGLTPGHNPSPPLDFAANLGVEQTDRNAQRCFGCHTTGGEPGVQCQSCHGSGDAHRSRPGRANIQRDRSVALCASCHRAPDGTFQSNAPELDDARSIRFAPVGFVVSECYRKSSGFTCVSCHDPHGEAGPAANTVCAGCHASAHAKVRAARSNCIGCHMRSSSPMAGLTFTDHRIRVYPE